MECQKFETHRYGQFVFHVFLKPMHPVNDKRNFHASPVNKLINHQLTMKDCLRSDKAEQNANKGSFNYPFFSDCM